MNLHSNDGGNISPQHAIPLCGKHVRQSCARNALALAAHLRMRHDCGNSNNQEQ
jgi:hypothetical protein